MNLEQYKSISDKFESLFTLLVYDITLEEIINKLYTQLKKIQSINSSFKKKYINDRLYGFILYLQENKMDNKTKLNSIFLLGKKIECIKLTKKYTNILNEYNISNYQLFHDNYFKIDYLDDLFTNFIFYDVLYLDKKIGKHYILNKNKKKEMKTFVCVKELDLTTYINKNIKKRCLINGNNIILKNYKLKNNFIINKRLKDDDILDIFVKEEMKEKHEELQKCFDMIKNEKDLHLIVYGKLTKEIKEAVENYRLKKLFIHNKYLQKLKQIVSEDCFNFDLIIIDNIDNNDIGQKLIDEYNGVIGISYY